MIQTQLEIINFYGVDHQLHKLTEECSELIQSITDYNNTNENFDHVVEEMSDVLNLIEQICIKENLTQKLVDYKRYKLLRQQFRIEDEKKINENILQ